MVNISPVESVNEPNLENRIKFRWIYIVLPAAILLVSVILTISFYGRLPAEVAYHFDDGSPDRWMSRNAIIAWLLIPHFFLVFIGATMSVGGTWLSKRFQQTDNYQISNVLLIMGNMVALPQIILTFAMLDIFVYNAYQINLIPLWIFVLLIIVLGSFILGIFFIRTLRQSQAKQVDISGSENNDRTSTG